jgi:prepilin-type N-terminal cleavage/methylation domain-containing protein
MEMDRLDLSASFGKIIGLPMKMYHLADKGFTLLEVLLAFFIFSILFVTIYASYSGTFKTINLTEKRMELYRKAAISLEKISEDLQSSYISIQPPGSIGQPAGYTQFLGENNDINGQEADNLNFYSRVQPLFSNEAEAVSGQLISYSVIQGGKENELVLLRSEKPEFLIEDEERGGLVLCDGLQAINFIYYDYDGNAQEQWDSDSEEFNGNLPRVVSIMLEFLNSENPEAPFKIMTSVAMPVN